MKTFKHYINGQLISGNSKDITVTRPEDGKVCAVFSGAGVNQAQMALEGADKAFKIWSELPLADRTKWMNTLSDAIRSRREEILDLLMEETGKLYEGAEYDCDMLFDCLDFYPAAARNTHGEILEDSQNEMLNMVIRKPVGVVVAYLAWNFPLLNVAYKIGPALASGCTIVIKPSSVTPLATMLLGEILDEINFPEGVINILAGSSGELGPVLSGSRIPAMITMIGSTKVGLQVIKESATSIKHFSLELGGNAPVLVMDDADLELAAGEIVGLKFSNTGQICVAPNRVYAHENCYLEFLDILKKKTSVIQLAAGRTEGNCMAPMINKADRDKMLDLIEDAVSKGAKILCGGKVPDDKPVGGNWITPCVLFDVTSEMRVYQEEIFGPVLPVIKFAEGDDVVSLGNDSPFGLTSYLFTTSLDNALKISRGLDSGTVCVNKPFYSVDLPHGGIKQSGLGKDCSHYSLDEYYNIKRISIAK